MYRCVIFDLDGTLIDSSKGIIHGYKYSLKKIGKLFPGTEYVQRMIGAPLSYVFEKEFGLNNEELQTAIFYYRNYYQQKGKKEVHLYPGIAQCLQRLKSSDLFLSVATLKREDFALEILRSLRISHYFNLICGTDTNDSLTKKDMIWMCLDRFGCLFEDAILVGDSCYDAQGAALAGIDFLPVTYGFGYRSAEDLKSKNIFKYADSPCQISELILGK